jgi:hypothetical protein
LWLHRERPDEGAKVKLVCDLSLRRAPHLLLVGHVLGEEEVALKVSLGFGQLELHLERQQQRQSREESWHRPSYPSDPMRRKPNSQYSSVPGYQLLNIEIFIDADLTTLTNLEFAVDVDESRPVREEVANLNERAA